MKHIKAFIRLLTILSVSIITAQQTDKVTTIPIKLHKEIQPKIRNLSSQNATSSVSTYLKQGVDGGRTIALEEVNSSGGFSYTIPIQLPNATVGTNFPDITLSYAGQSRDGVAGYGWNLTGISSITRTPSTMYHDGVIDPVDFDSTDRFTLDGQRLMLISGGYGQDGSEYQTEEYSHLKIKAYGTSDLGANYGPKYFIVFYPDGSRSWYGLGTSSNRLQWSIYRTDDPQGNRIEYRYQLSNGLLRIYQITFGGNGTGHNLNSITFSYKNRDRIDQKAFYGSVFKRTHLLDKIEVHAGGDLFRRYQLSHDATSLGYQRLVGIQESGADNRTYAPIKFQYDNSNDVIQPYQTQGNTTIFPGIDYKVHRTVSGDFNGDGSIDMLVHRKTNPNEFHLFTNLVKGNNLALGFKIVTGRFKEAFSSTTLSHSGATIPRETITTISETQKNIEFKTYALATSQLVYQYKKEWTASKFTTQADCSNTNNYHIPKTYLSGDFNGDGLTDVIAIERPYTFSICNDYCNDNNKPIKQELCCQCRSYTRDTKKAYFIDLNRQKTTNFSFSIGSLAKSIDKKDQLFVVDHNGDGKSDIVHFTQGSFYVYSLNAQNKLVREGRVNDASLSWNKPFFSGDFDGDGKTDYITPTANKSRVWRFYMNTGTGFKRYSKDIDVWYGENSIVEDHIIFKGQSIFDPIDTLYEFHYIPQDFNGDGKTDILSHHVITPVPDRDFSKEKISLHVNVFNSGTVDPEFRANTYSERDNIGLTKYGIPTFLDLNRANRNTEYAYIDGNYIYGYEFEKDHRKDVRLRSINNNRLITSITYNSDVSDNIYKPSSQSIYPYMDIPSMDNHTLVRMLTQKGSGLERTKLFRYESGVAHAQGLGFLGFKRSYRSNWFGDNVGIIWNGTEQDMTKRGAITKQWASLTASQTGFHTISTNTYNSSTTPKKVFVNKMERSTNRDILTGVTTNRSITYDEYLNPLTIRNDHGDGYTLETFTYSNKPTALDNTYHIGRVTSMQTEQNIDGLSFKTNEAYKYQNNLRSQLIKRTASESLTYSYEYDAKGSLTQKTSPATSGVWTETFTYDNTSRYITKSKNHLGQITEYKYNTKNGNLLSKKDPFGLTTSYTYDGWGRVSSITDQYGKKTTIDYGARSDGGMLTYTNVPKGTNHISVTNAFGWKVFDQYNSRSVALADWNQVSYQYDIAGRMTSESEPFRRGSAAGAFNKTYYDAYGRVVSQTFHTGKQIQISYNGLSTSVSDGTKTITTTKNTGGNIVEVNDPGGKITYTYHGNGSVKFVNYDGYSNTIEIDQWGRKYFMSDPSAGRFSYRYNKIGQLTKEINHLGETTFEYNPNGLLKTKVVSGQNTDIKHNYYYDSKFRLISSTGTVNNSDTYLYAYTYDNQNNHLVKVSENVDSKGAKASYEKEIKYDGFGMVSREIYKATNKYNQNQSITDVAYIYEHNGALQRIQEHGSNKVLWEAKKVNPRGQLEEALLGNGLSQKRTYDTYGNISEMKDAIGGDQPITALHMQYNFDATRELLTQRTNKIYNYVEDFKYDNLDRLTSNTFNGVASTQSYDHRGNITTNSELGTYTYNTQSQYRLEELDLQGRAINYYKSRSHQNVKFNSFKKPLTFFNPQWGGQSFEYSPMQKRSFRYPHSEETLEPSKAEDIKMYSSILPIEISYSKKKDVSRIVTYIGGDAYSANVANVVEGEKGYHNGFHYLHRDYLGSILGVTNANKKVLAKGHFDPWGKIKRYQSDYIDRLSHTGIFLVGRGFTGHEHFRDNSVIHMNGRIYDPNLRRFLSPDNFIQDPFNSQSFNRYGYAWNNPLKFTDPSGEVIFTAAVIIGIAVGAYFGGVQANGGEFNPTKWDWKSGKTYTGVLIGGTVGGLSAGVGSAITGTLTASTSLGSVLATGIGGASGGFIQGGAFSLMPGGDGKVFKGAAFGTISGFTGGVAGGAFSNLNIGINGINSPALRSLVGGTIGGYVGGYASGFTTGLIQTGDFDQAFEQGKSSGLTSAVIGGTAALGTSFALSKQNNVNWLTGKSKLVPTEGQMHHLLSKKVLRALERHDKLKGVFNREDPRFKYQALDTDSHKGYQRWHRQYDAEVANWIDTRPKATPQQFVKFLNEIHQRPEIKARIPNVNITW